MRVASFALAFAFMEFAAWFLHKYAMHGFLWSLHKDHHEPARKRIFKNDAFALVFAVPSFLMILLGNVGSQPLLEAAGYGVMAYGAVYFFVHEAIIHRRFRFLRGRGRYLKGLIAAHAHHHLTRTKDGAANFGLLIVDLKYFRDSRPKRPV